MPIAAYKDLCIDAIDPVALGRFWAGVLGLELHTQDGGAAYLTGAGPHETVWINRVEEAKTVKHRMHLDVNASSVEAVERLGATVLDADSFRWTVMADPEGGEFCVFVRTGEIPQRLYDIVVDTADSPAAAHRIAAWWGDVLDVEVVDDPRGYSFVRNVPGLPCDGISFIPVPEPKTVKNRIHIDVTVDDVDDLVRAGATILRPRDEQIRWTVLADPGGNEFCAFVT